MNHKGTLYLVATPIGNLEDITFRAIRVLKEVDLIAAEDTRHTLKLLNHLEISKPLTSFFRHNEESKGGSIINRLLNGENIAIVSDAGTPGISDPGEELVSRAISEGITVVPIPGPVAAISGLIVSGLPTDRFVFEGFLPVNKKLRKKRLQSLKDEPRTIIFYEAPHKLLTTLKDIYSILGERRISLARELTKVYEEVVRVNLSQAVELYKEKAPRGEFVVLLEGRQENNEAREDEEELTLSEQVQVYIEEGMDKKEAMKKVALERNISKRDVYNQLLKDEEKNRTLDN